MKLLQIVVSSAVIACLTFSALGGINDDSGLGSFNGNGKQFISLSLTTNDVVLIKNAAGAVAVIQFTSFGPYTAAYRWRCLPANSKAITSGSFASAGTSGSGLRRSGAARSRW